MMRRVLWTLAAAMLPLTASLAEAQVPSGGGRPVPPRRAQMEQQFRRQLWQLAKQRMGFSETQMAKLQQTSARFDERRRALAVEERAHRLTLRRELLADAAADDGRVATALDRLLELQRERADVQIAEQREFAAFMTPVQRAKYAALQEQVRRRVDSLRRQRSDSGRGGP